VKAKYTQSEKTIIGRATGRGGGFMRKLDQE